MTTTNTSTANPIRSASEFVSTMSKAVYAFNKESEDRDHVAAETFAENGAGDRDGYLAWVAEYKKHVKACAQEQRELKAAARAGDEGAQSLREYNRSSITRLLLLRRIGKVAARINRERKLAAEAA